MDLAALPTRQVLRWDLAVRIALAVLVPLGIQAWRTGTVTGPTVAAALVAALISMASLGPDLVQPRWFAVAAVATPIAAVGGTVLGTSATGGVVWVFGLYAVQGALTQAGLVSQLAWFPVATVGLATSVLATRTTPIVEVAMASLAGSAWAVVLMLVVPRVVHAPRVPLPPGALAVDADRLRRMLTHPSWREWGFPVLLGAVATTLLVVVDHLTEGFKPYWAVFALVGVLAPTAAATRRSALQTVASTLAGILLAAGLLATGWPPVAVLGTTVAMGLVGAVLLVRSGTVSKVLLTPLPVLLAAAALGPEGGLALGMRLLEYLGGAGVGLVAATAGEALARRLRADRPSEQLTLVG